MAFGGAGTSIKQAQGVEAASNCFSLSLYSKRGMITRPVDFILISIDPSYIGYLSPQPDKRSMVMTPGPWEVLVLLPILLLAIVFGLSRLARFIKQLKRTSQHQPSSEPQFQTDHQISGYKPYGWIDKEIRFREKDEVRDRG